MGYVATLSERLATLYARILPLAIRTPPLSLEARPVQMLWHRRSEGDAGARFFRELVAEISAKAWSTRYRRWRCRPPIRRAEGTEWSASWRTTRAPSRVRSRSSP